MATKDLFSAVEVIDESLPGFSDEALGDVLSTAEKLLRMTSRRKERAAKCPRKVFLPPPLCASPSAMIRELMPLFDDTSLKHALSNAKRLIKTRHHCNGLAKDRTSKAVQWKPKVHVADGTSAMEVFQLLAGMTGDVDWNVWQLLEGMAVEPDTSFVDVFQLLAGMAVESASKSRPADAVKVDWVVWELLEGMAKDSDSVDWDVWHSLEDIVKTSEKQHLGVGASFTHKGVVKRHLKHALRCRPKMLLTDETEEFYIFGLLAGMAGEPLRMPEPVHTVTVDSSVWQLLDGMANERPLAGQKIYDGRSAEAANSAGSNSAEQGKRRSTATLPSAEEKTLLRHALRHSRRRPSKDEPCHLAGDHILITAASATIAFSPKQVAEYIVNMHKIYPAASSKPAPMPPPPSPKHYAMPSPRMFQQPGGRYGHVRHVARAF
eukprot:TRINITY_DN33563_c0_g1_i1.p1 TRINITY_DN33563_c0_g1~~TRINITY_DN33563_c0_g1_i1.p1  ORF type:complete len:449 (-),score=73.97 TRINITY_DN33563_c0_g1_i1:282-1583(-)